MTEVSYTNPLGKCNKLKTDDGPSRVMDLQPPKTMNPNRLLELLTVTETEAIWGLWIH